MNSKPSYSVPPFQSETPNSLVFELKGFGPVPGGFKNRKRYSKGHVYSEPKTKAWMERAASAIEYTFLSQCRTTDGVIPLECARQLLSAWSGLSDDSLREYPQGSWSTIQVPKGLEGVTITIERL